MVLESEMNGLMKMEICDQFMDINGVDEKLQIDVK